VSLNVFIGCEFSGKVREAFRKRGHNAVSCDLLAAADGSPYHVQCDVFEALNGAEDQWDLGIFHPPCTYLTISAEWAYGDGPYHQKVKPDTLVGAARRAARVESVEFVKRLYDSLPRVAIENPIGRLSSLFRKPDQVIQPYMFGHDASKATCLWLKGLPPLKPLPKEQWIAPRIVNGRPRWGNQTDSGQNRLSPSDDRWAVRSVTYQGIADAMAEQWGASPERRHDDVR
jgi:hypothetical protein